MPDAHSRVYGPAQPGTSNATIYTVPGSTTLVIRTIHICNTTGTEATVSLAINGSAATGANCLLEGFKIPPDGTYNWNGSLALAAGDTLQALQGTSAALTMTISGVLIT